MALAGFFIEHLRSIAINRDQLNAATQ
jgi:hypothetical protein